MYFNYKLIPSKKQSEGGECADMLVYRTVLHIMIFMKFIN